MIKNNINDCVGYQGNVEIYIKKKNGRIKKVKTHNAGNIGLFTVIAKLLSTDSIYDRDSNIPKYIDVCLNDSSIISNKASITASKVTSNSETVVASVSYTATLDYYDMTAHPTSSDVVTLKLYNSKNTELATTTIDESQDPTFSNVTAGMQIIISLTLTFQNSL